MAAEDKERGARSEATSDKRRWPHERSEAERAEGGGSEPCKGESAAG